MEEKKYIGEVWKPIMGFEGLYEVSNYGRVKSLERIVKGYHGLYKLKERILKLFYSRYVGVKLSKDGCNSFHSIHRMMAEAFLPNPHNYQCVNHKDEDRYNNFIWVNEDGSVDPDKSNLEWCTQKYNVNYGTGIERCSNARKNNPKKSTPILQFSLSGDLIKEYPSIAEAHRQTGINKGNIGECCRYNKKYTHAGGFIWRFKNIA